MLYGSIYLLLGRIHGFDPAKILIGLVIEARSLWNTLHPPFALALGPLGAMCLP